MVPNEKLVSGPLLFTTVTKWVVEQLISGGVMAQADEDSNNNAVKWTEKRMYAQWANHFYPSTVSTRLFMEEADYGLLSKQDTPAKPWHFEE